MIRSPKDRDTIPTMDTDVTEPQPSRDGSRRDDNPTWTTAVYRQLEPALARAEGPRIATVEENVEEHLRTMLREAENENGETDPHANDTEPEPLPPFTDGAATTGDAAADAEWRAMIATAEDDDPAFPGRPGETEQERVRRIMDGFARRAQQERVGPPVVARVTDGNPAAVYSAPPTAVPAATRTPHAPGRVHFAHTERLPLPVVPPPPASEPPPSGVSPAASPVSVEPVRPEADVARRQAPTFRIPLPSTEEPSPSSEPSPTLPRASRAWLLYLGIAAAVLAVGSLTTLAIVPSPTSPLPAPSEAPSSSSVAPPPAWTAPPEASSAPPPAPVTTPAPTSTPSSRATPRGPSLPAAPWKPWPHEEASSRPAPRTIPPAPRPTADELDEHP
jgi:hypothetical protein